MTKSRSKIQLIPYQEAYEEGFEDMPRRVPDLSKISRLVGFRPNKTLMEMIQSVIDQEGTTMELAKQSR
ncbi:hypothetical protein MYX65_08435 [Acidobacteria bacterium AH-259-L09]|nr:hypothetical protein [Acidobacteria bacterium AH-259-L09]